MKDPHPQNGDPADAKEQKERARARVRELAEQHRERNDPTGWFDELYRESAGDISRIPWADLEPNRFLRDWAESSGLEGKGRKALVVGCGLGDDARYLYDLGFKVTGFDISPAAIEWARKLHADTDIQFEIGGLFHPDREWLGAFDLVAEVYTIQPLPMELRPRVIDSIGSFVSADGRLVVVTRGREDDVEPDELPWPLSRRDLSRFEMSGLRQIGFNQVPVEDEPPRFIVEYVRS